MVKFNRNKRISLHEWIKSKRSLLQLDNDWLNEARVLIVGGYLLVHGAEQDDKIKISPSIKNFMKRKRKITQFAKQLVEICTDTFKNSQRKRKNTEDNIRDCPILNIMKEDKDKKSFHGGVNQLGYEEIISVTLLRKLAAVLEEKCIIQIFSSISQHPSFIINDEKAERCDEPNKKILRLFMYDLNNNGRASFAIIVNFPGFTGFNYKCQSCSLWFREKSKHRYCLQQPKPFYEKKRFGTF